MSKWEMVKLKNVAMRKLEYGSGASAIEYDGGIRYIRITDIDYAGRLGNDPVSPSIMEEKYILEEGDILFARSGATVGKTFLYHKVDGFCIFAGYLIRFVPNKQVVNPKYVYYYTRSSCYQSFVESNKRVVAQPNINAQQYSELEIPLPPLETQKQIAKTLDTAAELLAMRKQQLAELDKLIKSEFYDMFGDPITNEKRWAVNTLDDVCDKITDGTHQTPEYSDEGYIFISSKNVTSGAIDWDNIKYIPEHLHKELYKRLSPQMNDILLAKNGTTGVAAIVNRDCIFNIYVSLALLRPNSRVNPIYLLKAINSDACKYQFDKSLKGIGVPNLHLNSIKKVKLLVPPLPLQTQFASIVTKIEEQKALVKKAIDETQHLFDSLMSEYFD